MAVTPTIQNTQPVVGASFDSWGALINDRLQETYTDINALATQVNIDTPLASGALPKSGGTMTGDAVLADVFPGSPLSVGFRGIPVVSVDADHSFVNTDSGKCIRLIGTTARSWTLSNATFYIGTTLVVRNFSTQPLSIVRSGISLRVVGSATDANRSIAPQGQAVLFQEDTNVWTIQGIGVS